MTSKEEKNEIARVIVLIILTMVVLAWTMINADGFVLPALMYIALGFVSIGWILVFNKFGKKIHLWAIDRNIGTDFLIGVGIGVAMIVLSLFNVIGSILLPYVPASFTTDAGHVGVRVIGAMVIESVFFFMLMIQFLDNKLDSWGIDLPFSIAVLITAGAFSFFHYTVYTLSGGTISSVLGSFLSVAFVTFIWGYTMKFTKSILPLVISHGIINFYLLNQIFRWISFGG